MQVAPSARKHGISDAAMHHALRNVMKTVPQDDEHFTLYIGFDHAGVALEIVVMDEDPDNEPIIIHAMKLRKKFHGYLYQ